MWLLPCEPSLLNLSWLHILCTNGLYSFHQLSNLFKVYRQNRVILCLVSCQTSGLFTVCFMLVQCLSFHPFFLLPHIFWFIWSSDEFSVYHIKSYSLTAPVPIHLNSYSLNWVNLRCVYHVKIPVWPCTSLFIMLTTSFTIPKFPIPPACEFASDEWWT